VFLAGRRKIIDVICNRGWACPKYLETAFFFFGEGSHEPLAAQTERLVFLVWARSATQPSQTASPAFSEWDFFTLRHTGG
jgi:hypothetical protein